MTRIHWPFRSRTSTRPKTTRQTSRPTSNRSVARRRAMLLESLEERRLLTTYLVDTNIDVVNAADGFTSLREAIQAANAGAGSDTIKFKLDAPLAAPVETIKLTNGELAITDSLTIDGANVLGSGVPVTVSGEGNSRVFNVAAGVGIVAFKNMTISKGNAGGQSGGGILATGGTTNVTGVTFDSNVATTGGGAIEIVNGSGAITGNTYSMNTPLAIGIEGTTNVDIITVNATKVVVNNTKTITFDAVPSLGVFALAGNDTINVTATALGTTTTVNAGGGNDTINVSSNAPTNTGNVDGIKGALTINGDAGSDTLVVSDSSGTADLAGQLTDTQITGLGTGAISYAVDILQINLSNGNDIFNIRATKAGTQTTINAGAGIDTINVSSDAAANQGSVSLIAGPLTIKGGAGTDKLFVNDLGGTTDGNGSLTATQITGLGNSGAITYDADVEELTLDLSKGNDVLTVLGTHAGKTTINGNGGNDTINVRATAAGSTTTVDAGAGTDTINVSSDSLPVLGNVNGIAGQLTINDNDIVGIDTLNVIDIGGTADPAGQLTDTKVTKLGNTGDILYNKVDTLVIDLSNSADKFNVLSTAATTKTTVNAGGGDDTINVSSNAPTNSGNVDGIKGVLTINGEAGNDSLVVSDSGGTADANGMLTATQITNLGNAGAITYSVETLGLDLSQGKDTFNVRSTAATTVTTVNAGAGINTINVSSDAAANQGSVSLIAGPLTIKGGADTDKLFVSDLGGIADSNGVLTATQITGLGNAGAITYDVNVEELTLDLSAGNDVLTVLSTHVGTTTINANGGADIINVRSTAATSTTTVNAGTGADIINVSSDADANLSNLNGIAGDLTVIGGADADTLNVSDFGGTADPAGFLTATQITGLGNTGKIIYKSAGDVVETLRLDLSKGNDTLNVLSTSAVTTVNAGDGNDTINVSSDAPAMNSGNVNGIAGALTINGDLGNDNLFVSDIGGAADAAGQLTATQITGLGNAGAITYAVETLRLDLSNGDDKFTVVNTHAGTTTINADNGNDTINVRATTGVTTVNAGAGNDTINVSSDAPTNKGNVNGIAGALTINGDADIDKLFVSDFGGAADSAGVLTPTLITGLGNAGTITYTPSVEELTVDLSNAGDDVLTVVNTHAGKTTINGNGGADVINVRATALGSDTTINGGGGPTIIPKDASNDTFNISSDANGDLTNRSGTPVGSPAGNLDGIKGKITVDGGDHLTGAADLNQPASVTAHGVTAPTVPLTLPVGDTLNISDEASTGDNTYALSATTFAKTVVTATGLITYTTIETVNVETGSGIDTVAVNGTVGTTTLDTYDGRDVVTVNNTGASSVLLVNTAADIDKVTINNTGAGSVTKVSAGLGNDTLTLKIVAGGGDGAGVQLDGDEDDDGFDITSTGKLTALLVRGGAGDDRFGVTGTAAVTTTELLGDFLNPTPNDGADVFDIGHRLDDIQTPPLIGTGSVEKVLGPIFIDGGEGPTIDMVTQSTTARHAPGVPDTPLRQVTVNVSDKLFYSDAAATTEGTYALTSTIDPITTITSSTIDKDSAGKITYKKVESVAVRTGILKDTVTVNGTAASTALLLDTNGGDDKVHVMTTGAKSVSQIRTGFIIPGATSDMDAVTIDSTGQDSDVKLNTAASSNGVVIPPLTDDGDTVLVQATGVHSGLTVTTGDNAGTIPDMDTINIGGPIAATRPISGQRSLIQVAAGPDVDTFNINEVFLETVIDLKGEAGNDMFNVIAAGSDAAGNLTRINNEPLNTTPQDTVARTRELLLDGGANDAVTQDVKEGVSVSPVPPNYPASQGVVMGVPIGDTVNFNASAATTPLDLRYVITAAAQGVFMTPLHADPTQGDEVADSTAIENVNIISGRGDDVLTVSSKVPFGIANTAQIVRFDGRGSANRFYVLGTEQSDKVTVGDYGVVVDSTTEPFEIKNVAYLRVEGHGGNDQVANNTSAISVLDGGLGDDDMLGGSGSDILTGGAGLDKIFGNDGNDILMSDNDFGNDVKILADNEILNGGVDGAFPGDICIQVGQDHVLSCEAVGNGGGELDVLTWLRAIFIPLDAISFTGGSPQLTPFAPIAAPAAATTSTTEPSSLTPGAPFPIANSAFVPRTQAKATGEMAFDANDDGNVTTLDAMVVLNQINRKVGKKKSAEGESKSLGYASADVNHDGQVTSVDALLILNQISRLRHSHAAANLSTLSASGTANAAQTQWQVAVDAVFGAVDKARTKKN